MKSKTRALFFRYRYPARFVRLFIGLVLFGLSSALNVRSMLGLSPWNAFHQGLSLVSGLSIGRITQLCGIVIIGIDLLMREPIGFGTIFNMILVGGSLDFFLASGLIPETNSLLWRTVLLLLGIFVTALGSYLYMSAAMGAGPRDSMMVGLAKRLPRVPVGIVRNMIELTALAIGWWEPEEPSLERALDYNCNNLTSDAALLGGEIQAFSCRGIPCRVEKFFGK